MQSLRKFLRLGIGASDATITGTRRPLGYQQIVAATIATTAAGLTIPTSIPAGSVVGYAIIQSNGGVVRWRDDATDPTSSVGMVIPDGGELNYVGDFTAIKFIKSTGTPLLDISFYA